MRKSEIKKQLQVIDQKLELLLKRKNAAGRSKVKISNKPYKDLLYQQNLRQTDVAKKVKINKAHMSLIVNNQQNLRVSTIAKLMKFHGINNPWLIVNFDSFINKRTTYKKRKVKK